jgi:hypothetical protein
LGDQKIGVALAGRAGIVAPLVMLDDLVAPTFDWAELMYSEFDEGGMVG